MIDLSFTRRQALGLTAAILAGLKIRRGHTQPSLPVSAVVPPPHELVNAFEFRDQAELALPRDLFTLISGSNRTPFDRMTFRPRVCSPTIEMDLTTPMFGAELYTPIIVGPIADQGRFHPEGELATVRGAGASYTSVVVSSRSSVPFAQLAAEATTPLWFNVYVEPDARGQADAAVSAGAAALFITVGTAPHTGAGTPLRTPVDWRAVETIRRGVTVPVVIKGVTTPQEATAALQQGVQGIVVSNHGVTDGPGAVEALASIAETVGGRAQVLVDGSFRRGTDVLKALILGADGVLLARPISWGLGAYGSDGVQHVLRLIQNELARSMAMLGAPTTAHLRREHVQHHQRATA